MVRYRKCSVKGCEDITSTRHSFPNPRKCPEQFSKWLDACANEDLYNVAPEIIFKCKKVCAVHFPASSKKTLKYLMDDAIPSLHLPNLSNIGRLESSEHIQEVGSSPMTPTLEEQPCTPSTSTMPILEDQPSAPSTSTTATNGDNIHTPPRRSLLRSCGVTRSKELTPKAKKMYIRAKALQRSRRLFQKKASTLSKIEMVEKVTFNLEPHVKSFIKTQILQQGKSKHGRRFSMNEKILALVLYKQSSRSYKYLEKLFCIPSKTTLKKLLSRIPVRPGINKFIFDNLKKIKLQPREKLCLLLFDEMAIEPSILFNSQMGEFEGFEDLGDRQTPHIANHVLVFMIKGIVASWKQPLSFIFTKGATNHIDLVCLIKNHIHLCREAGFTVVGSISDQGSNNCAAINYLMKTTTQDYRDDVKFYTVDNLKVHHIYDPPHLLKGIRNNLLKNNLVMRKDGVISVAKWSDIETAYKIDNGCGEFRALPKLTESHVNPLKLKKMKVSCASQVFSNTVASVINLLRISGYAAADGSKLAEDALGTANVLKYFDSLFDSVNGHLKTSTAKPLKGCIQKHSPHFQFWKESKDILKSMYFMDHKNQKCVPPSIRNWVVTINALEEIFKALPEDITFMKGRQFNQDPLENFFGQMRQRGARNNNPSSQMFKYHFRTYLINSIGTKHSINANCEVDQNSLLTSVKQLLQKPSEVTMEQDFDNDLENLTNMNIPLSSWNYISKQATGYITGFIFKKLDTTIGNCYTCREEIFTDTISDEWHILTEQKEYSGIIPRKLKYCSREIIFCFFKMYNLIIHILPKYCHRKKCYVTLYKYLFKTIDFNFNCDVHKKHLKDFCIKQFLILCCHNWATGANRILSGRDLRSFLKNSVYIEAQKMCRKRKL